MSRHSLTILVLVSGLFLAGILPYRSDLGWIDPVTGSMKYQTQCFLVPVSTIVEQSAVVENWMFDPARKLNEISPILTENGAYHIVQILAVDPSFFRRIHP